MKSITYKYIYIYIYNKYSKLRKKTLQCWIFKGKLLTLELSNKFFWRDKIMQKKGKNPFGSLKPRNSRYTPQNYNNKNALFLLNR